MIRTTDREVLFPFVTAGARGRRARRPDRHRRPSRTPGRGLMRIDVVSIFPEYLAPLGLSLAGKAQESGLLDVHVHDLRDWTHDRHRTVDDTPYGGGAGMVMKPEPWGEALDARRGRRRHARRTHASGSALHPGGRRRAGDARAPRLRVRSLRGHRPAGDGRRGDADGGARALDRRLRAQRRRGRRAGDHRGGRAAAAGVHGQRRVAGRGVLRRRPAGVPRLHQARQLAGPRACPTCCCPATTRGSPPGATTESVRRTAERRPDLAHASRAVDLGALPARIALAAPSDAAELFTLQRACWVQEQQANPGVHIPPLHEDFADVQAWLGDVDDAGAAQRRPARRRGPRSARGGRWDVGRLMVAPDLQGRGHRPGAARRDRARCPGRGDRLRAVHRRAAASATSGCTRRPATGCAARTRTSPAPYG